VQTALQVPTLLATTTDNPAKRQQLEQLGLGVVVMPKKDGLIDLASLLQELGRRNIDSVLIEGGPSLLGSAFDAGLVQAVSIYLAPKIFGGSAAPSPIAGRGVSTPDEAINLCNATVRSIGEDLCIEGEVG